MLHNNYNLTLKGFFHVQLHMVGPQNGECETITTRFRVENTNSSQNLLTGNTKQAVAGLVFVILGPYDFIFTKRHIFKLCKKAFTHSMFSPQNVLLHSFQLQFIGYKLFIYIYTIKCLCEYLLYAEWLIVYSFVGFCLLFLRGMYFKN